ncbi:MAG: hypothetical protein L0215_07255 [Gemmataceae bacterium]|nr:hypothetical protein [Gemmataceae bacterium]
MRDARWVWLGAGGLLVLVCVALAFWFLPESEPTATGTVRLDNKLLAKGSIAFNPIDGTPGPGGGGVINKEGKYEIKQGLRPGKYQIVIRSTIETKRPVRDTVIPSEIVPAEESVIPEQYNAKSILFREVRPGANVFDFPLERVASSK